MRLRGLAETYIYNRSRALARMTGELSPVPLLTATAGDLLAWRAGLARLTPDATAAYLSHAREFYAWALGAGHISADPSLSLPGLRRRPRLPRPVAEADALAAVELAPQPVRCWLVLAGWCGLRAREIALLSRECILEQSAPPVLLVDAEAAKGRRERIVPLSAFVLGELAALGLPASGWAFPRRDGRPGPNMPWRVSQLCNVYLHDLGLPVTLHQWRHRFGTQAYAACRDLRAVQELMGHGHPQTTALYVAYSASAAAEAVEALPVPATPGDGLARGRSL